MFFSRAYNKLRRTIAPDNKQARKLTVKDHERVHGKAHGRDLDSHVVRNGHLELGEYLASIGVTGQFEVWAEVVDVNGNTGAETDAYLDAMADALADALERGDDHVDMPMVNDPMSMANGQYIDDLGHVTIYTIVDHETQTIIGDAIRAYDQERWYFEYHPEYMGCVCN